MNRTSLVLVALRPQRRSCFRRHPSAERVDDHWLGAVESQACSWAESLARLVVSGELDPCVKQVRPLDEAGAALAEVEHGHVVGKVVLVP
ncbi:zinc-binding dehydrogenase [Saccharopolyspora sp. WRP15-2]|uniref:Zinc-binding dehydrogenase n=1 Tax=Saccharopolyspora oryzae TaxID=2997343 RepID=A0ABT4V707_9PSEU|nr:zinc-binding dehydrogenase [Saccharopolyspora oryzae]MDA3629740.1 zinc-binding dehydrogenase [Saccharopolyspora oryzae]